MCFTYPFVFRSSTSNGKKKKSPEQATIPEGSEEDGEDTTAAVSVSTSIANSEEFDTEAAVAKALEESLGAAGDDPDIIEAKQRLLDSKVLSADFFDTDDGNSSFSSDDAIVIARWGLEEVDSQVDGLDTERAVPTESTGLLFGVGSPSAALRPSIFTAVASIAENERQSATMGTPQKDE